jgi:hypothetical protein
MAKSLILLKCCHVGRHGLRAIRTDVSGVGVVRRTFVNTLMNLEVQQKWGIFRLVA